MLSAENVIGKTAGPNIRTEHQTTKMSGSGKVARSHRTAMTWTSADEEVFV